MLRSLKKMPVDPIWSTTAVIVHSKKNKERVRERERNALILTSTPTTISIKKKDLLQRANHINELMSQSALAAC